MMQRTGARGFTLLELLVALAVFSFVAVMAYGGLNTVLNTNAHVTLQAERLKQVQWALLTMERDISQLVLRPVRDDYGDSLPALHSSLLGLYSLELTHDGWSNPAGLPRSSLQRVSYGISERGLVRHAWPVLDRAPGSEPRELTLLTQVASLGWRFLDQDGAWHEEWPPLAETEGGAERLPVIIEVTLRLEDWGTIRRLIRTPRGMAL